MREVQRTAEEYHIPGEDIEELVEHHMAAGLHTAEAEERHNPGELEARHNLAEVEARRNLAEADAEVLEVRRMVAVHIAGVEAQEEHHMERAVEEVLHNPLGRVVAARTAEAEVDLVEDSLEEGIVDIQVAGNLQLCQLCAKHQLPVFCIRPGGGYGGAP